MSHSVGNSKVKHEERDCLCDAEMSGLSMAFLFSYTFPVERSV